MSASLVARAMAKRPAPPEVGAEGSEESKELSIWRGVPRRPGEAHIELPDSLKRAKVDREVPLEAEVVRRERPQEVEVDIHLAAALKPADRQRWLTRALEGIAREASRPSDLYDVVSHKRFAAGISPALARNMMEELRKQASSFPEKLKQSILTGSFPLGEAASSANATSTCKDHVEGSRTADEIMARCVNFVRRNEEVIAKVHELEARTFHVDLQRSSLQQVWGLTWARAAFNAQRRVLEAVVPDSPAGLASRLRAEAGEGPLQPGDELVALNGVRGWEAMGRIRELLYAKLTFVRNPVEPKGEDDASGNVAGSGISKEKEAYTPPLFSRGGYTLEAGSGWHGHLGGQWLFSKKEEVYFHVPTAGLFIEDPAKPGNFVSISAQDGLDGSKPSADAEAAPCQEPAPAQQQPARLRGRIRWFSRAKGFGFISPWPGEEATAGGGATGSRAPAEEQDLFVHRKQLLPEAESATAEVLPLLPGMPVSFCTALQDDGRPCAEWVSPEADLSALCSAGCSLGSAARCIQQAAVELKGHNGQSTVGAFAGLATGRRGMGGAEYVALHLPRDLASCLQGREQGGERGARAALLAAFRQTQHGFLQYAQRLSENSAGRWLAAETGACTVLVFGPDMDGRPRALFTFAGGGRALVGRRDGSVSACLGDAPVAEGEASRAPQKKASEDNLKVFERGLKGPPITFPPLFGSHGQPAPEGFGAHNWSEKDGAAAGLTLDVHSAILDWEEDAFLVLGSTPAWEALPEDEEVVRLALQGIQEQGPGCSADRAAQRIMEALRPVRAAKRETPQDVAISVLRLSWCAVEGEEPPEEAAEVDHGPGTASAEEAMPVDNTGDIFADASAVEIQRQEEAENAKEEPSAPRSKRPLAGGARRAPWPTLQAATAAGPPADQGPQNELDDMFASFCREIDGLQPGA